MERKIIDEKVIGARFCNNNITLSKWKHISLIDGKTREGIELIITNNEERCGGEILEFWDFEILELFEFLTKNYSAIKDFLEQKED